MTRTFLAKALRSAAVAAMAVVLGAQPRLEGLEALEVGVDHQPVRFPGRPAANAATA